MRLRIIDFKKKKVYEHSDILEKGIGTQMLDKYPGGKWVTMRGRHVYITKDGNITKETNPVKNTSADVRGKARRLYEASTDNIRKGSVYRYGNSMVVVNKVGEKHVQVQNASGKSWQVLKSKFAQNAEKEAGGKNNVQDLKEIQKEAPGTMDNGMAGKKSADDPTATGTKEKEPTRGSEDAKPAMTSYATKTPQAFKAKGFEIQSDYTGDEAYDTYEKWKKYADKAKAYFQIKMVQLGDVSPERRAEAGITLRKITKGGEIAGFVQLQDHPNATEDGSGVVEVGYAEVAPHMRKGNGIGQQILCNAIAESYDKGYGGRIYLKSHADALGFYKKIGMNWLGGQYNEFDFTPEQATAFYEHVTGEPLGDEIKKSLDAKLTTKAKRPSKFPSVEEMQKAEDRLYPVGFLLGDFNERMRRQSEPKYKTREVNLDEE